MNTQKYVYNSYHEDGENNENNQQHNSHQQQQNQQQTNQKMFTQEELNTILASEKRKTEGRLRALQEQLATAKTSGLSAQEKQELEERIAKLRQEYQTKEQLAAERLKKKEEEALNKIKALELERDQFKSLYTEEVITSSLMRAATSSDKKPINPMLLVDLLKPKTKLEPVLDETGSPTGRFAPKVSLQAKDEKGNDVVLALSPDDAVKRMAADTANYGSLFGSNQKGGPGTGSHVPGGFDLSNPEAYRAIRKAGQHRNIGV